MTVASAEVEGNLYDRTASTKFAFRSFMVRLRAGEIALRDFPFLQTAGCGVQFDEAGPRIDGHALLRKTAAGFAPLTKTELAGFLDEKADIVRLHSMLDGIARQINDGEIGLAGLATAFLPPITVHDASDIEPVAKAATDDPDHPGWPAGSPDSQGGQFRPKDFGIDKSQIRKRLASRRSFRSIARRILTAKRVLRLLGENTAAALTEEIPGVDAVLTGMAVKDDIALLEDLAADVNDSEAAMAAVKSGPKNLGDLMSAKAPKDFETYAELKKLDLVRYISAADEGEEIHHIVEQSQIGGAITNRMVQSTENVVKIPRLIHEEINSIYATKTHIGDRFISPREYLRGRSYEEQRKFGLDTLREVGILR